MHISPGTKWQLQGCSTRHRGSLLPLTACSTAEENFHTYVTAAVTLCIESIVSTKALAGTSNKACNSSVWEF